MVICVNMIKMMIMMMMMMMMMIKIKITVATLQTICPGTPAISQAPVQPAQDPI